ncbi:MAG: efflux RND transporter permease subunit [Rikenellaceae bacterium]|nr:efflux RND transporter permease subunit [Rikenellaceae bacterium]
MNIYEKAVRKPISTILIFVGVIFFGLFSLTKLAIDQFPEMEFPAVAVFTTYPGANAEEIETNVTRILEDQLNTVDNLEKITSTSSDNYSIVNLELEWGSDITEATNDVRDVINRSSKLLPDGAEQPIVFKFSSSMQPIMILSVTADESYAALNKELDEKLVNILNRIEGVGAVSLGGAPEREIQVNVDPTKLEAYGLTVESLGQLIAAENVNIPAGTIDIGSNTYNIKADAEYSAGEQVRDVIVSNAGGRTIHLTDVAEVKDTLEKATQDVRMNGKRCVTVIIQKQSGANTVEIVKQVQAMLPSILQTLPPDIQIHTVYEGSESIIDSINSLSESVMYALIFVILVVMIFLGRWRATFIIALTIPISLITAFIYLFATGSTLNIISLSSLSIAIGMVVDDAIVVLENISTHIEKGSKPREAAIYGTNEVWLSVIATTLVVVAVFLPLTMLEGMMGIMFKELGWIVTIVVCTSTAAAVTLTPMLCAYILRLDGAKHNYKGVGIIYKPIDKFLNWLDGAYAKTLAWAVNHRAVVICSTMGLFAMSLVLLKFVPMEFFSKTDNASINATVKLEQNIGVDYTARIARQIDSIIYAKYPEVDRVQATAGASSSDNMFAAMSDNGSHIVTYRLKLPTADKRDRSIFEIADLLRQDLDQIPEIREYSISAGGSGPGGGSSPIEVKVFGHNIEVANAVALDLKAKITALDETRDVKLSREDLRPEFNVVFDREKLAYYGVSNATAANFVRNRINGYTATKYREDGDEYDIIVRYAEEHRTSLSDVENITLYSSTTGRPIKLKEVATVTEEFAAPSIEREDRQRVVKVESDMAPGVALGAAAAKVQTIIDAYDVPDGIFVELGGDIEDMNESTGDMMMLMVLIVILVYIVMATQFESMKMPFIIMFTIPFAFTGVFVALWLTGKPLSMIALIGAIMLVGIVVKNGIVMVDYTNLLCERGMKVMEAVVTAGKSRLRPVLMTSLTTIFGMVPMAIGTGNGSEMWQPMGIAIVGGLTFSTFLTLLVVPTIYASFQVRAERKAAKQKQLN